MARTPIASDARRAEAERRLQRAKVAIASGCAAITITVWTLVAGSAGASASTPTSAKTPVVSVPGGGFFDPAPNFTDARGQAPLLRSQGS
jgi:hypothetical protein